VRYNPAELIKKKRNGHAHTDDEIHFMIESFTSGALPEYQMSAWMMAIYFQGMNDTESAALTDAMLYSGRTVEFDTLKGWNAIPVDKHSTGGIGDKTSMILAPIVAAAGVPVPMIAGRGLGHTGGTLDKLESIPGFNISLSLDRFAKQVQTLGLSIIGQTEEICPADKRVYALRDVTATIESFPLICASIMSKKLAEGIGGLVLDVKFGTGAFMKTVADAEALADRLMAIGHARGKRVAALITSMDQPLGRFIGNSLEIGECVAILKNEPYLGWEPSSFADTRELSLELAAYMIWLGGSASSPDEGLRIANEVLTSGMAWTKFEELCRAQGGDLSALPMAKTRVEVRAETDGFVTAFAGEKLGLAAIALGAGRLKTTDSIDPTAGIEVFRKVGEHVEKGDLLYVLHGDRPESDPCYERARYMILSGTTISLQRVAPADLIARRKALPFDDTRESLRSGGIHPHPNTAQTSPGDHSRVGTGLVRGSDRRTNDPSL
jgi:pyrimidine-nucleoside phosphorylase